MEVINNYSNKNFYNYYAVIPRGTISVCQNRIIKKSLLIKALILPQKKNLKILIKRFIIPSFIGSFCLNNIFEYFHSNFEMEVRTTVYPTRGSYDVEITNVTRPEQMYKYRDVPMPYPFTYLYPASYVTDPVSTGIKAITG